MVGSSEKEREVLGAEDGLKALENALKGAPWVSGDSGNNMNWPDL